MIADALRLAREATNAWACYAKRKIELDEIARLHQAIDGLTALTTLRGAEPEPPPDVLTALQEEIARWHDQGQPFIEMRKHPDKDWFNGNGEALQWCAKRVREILAARAPHPERTEPVKLRTASESIGWANSVGPLDVAPRVDRQFAWVIERRVGDGLLVYWDGRGRDTSTSKHEEAVRFRRQEDAERVLHWMLETPDDWRTVEHGWISDAHVRNEV